MTESINCLAEQNFCLLNNQKRVKEETSTGENANQVRKACKWVWQPLAATSGKYHPGLENCRSSKVFENHQE